MKSYKRDDSINIYETKRRVNFLSDPTFKMYGV